MASVAFAIPRLEGSEDHEKELLGALTGERGGKVHARRAEHGFSRIKIWQQDDPRITIVYLEADDLPGAMAAAGADGDADNAWVSGMIQRVSGTHPKDHAVGHGSRLIMDWHPDKGHSATHH